MGNCLVIRPDGLLEIVPDRLVPADVEFIEIPDLKDIPEGALLDFARLSGCDYPIVAHDFTTQLDYMRLRDKGESHNMAKICATGRTPGLVTDSIFRKGNRNGAQFADDPVLGWHYRRQAEAAGQSTSGKVYLRSLADYPGDPSAWVADRGDVLAVCKAKGYSSSGLVDYRAPEQEPTPDVEIDPDLVAAEVADVLDSNPGLRPDDVHEAVYNLRAGRVDPNPLNVQE